MRKKQNLFNEQYEKIRLILFPPATLIFFFEGLLPIKVSSGFTKLLIVCLKSEINLFRVNIKDTRTTLNDFVLMSYC